MIIMSAGSGISNLLLSSSRLTNTVRYAVIPRLSGIGGIQRLKKPALEDRNYYRQLHE